MDWDSVTDTHSQEELNEKIMLLLEENLRLKKEAEIIEEEKKKLALDREGLKELQDSFMKERIRLRDEIDELNRKTLFERKRLKEENLFFDKKMAILQDGFRSLEEERRAFDAEKANFHKEKQEHLGFDGGIPFSNEDFSPENLDMVAEILFGDATNPLVLRKRYKDLVKIYHPDNFYGDKDLVAAINRVYQKRRSIL